MSVTQHRVGLVALLCLAGAAAQGGSPCSIELGQPDAVYATTRSLRFGLTVANPATQPVEGATLWVIIPARQTATQRCLRVQASEPGAVEEGPYDSQVLRLDLPVLAGLAKRAISVTCDLALAAAPQPTPLGTPETFLVTERYVEATDPAINKLAKDLRGSAVVDTARLIDQWIRANIKDAGYTSRDRGALACLQSQNGDCTEMAYLFVALCRANQVPARVIDGLYATTNAIVRPTDCHNWAEFHDGTTWRVADPQAKRFITEESCYIAMRIRGGSKLGPLGECHRFRVEPEGLRVRWNVK